MALDDAEPPVSLICELQEVARDANSLIATLGHRTNSPLPPEFPKEQLIEISRSLVNLPDGTAGGARLPLDYARNRLPAIRREYIPGDQTLSSIQQLPSLTRGTNIDVQLSALIASVTTAFDEYRRLAAEDPDHDSVPPPQSGAVPALSAALIASQTSSLGERLEAAGYTVQSVARGDSLRADTLKRQLSDAQGLNRLIAAEINMPRVVIVWLRKISASLRNYPTLIHKTIETLRVGTDVAETLVIRWEEFKRNFTSFGFSEWRKTLDTVDGVAGYMEARQTQKGKPNPASGSDFNQAVKTLFAGIIHRYPDPSGPPFVKLGSTVKEGDTLVLVEAMGVLGPIAAPYAGQITEFHVSDQEVVDVNQPILSIEPIGTKRGNSDFDAKQLSQPAKPRAADEVFPDETEVFPDETFVASPMVGTVYLSPQPGGAPFVKEGDIVEEGDTVLLVEAMKTMCPIAATRNGVITRMCVSDAQPVEFGQQLLAIGSALKRSKTIVRAPMQGIIHLSLAHELPFVEAGDIVKYGSVIVMIESQGSLHKIISPYTARISAIFVDDQQTVAEGDDLIRFSRL